MLVSGWPLPQTLPEVAANQPRLLEVEENREKKGPAWGMWERSTLQLQIPRRRPRGLDGGRVLFPFRRGVFGSS